MGATIEQVGLQNVECTPHPLIKISQQDMNVVVEVVGETAGDKAGQGTLICAAQRMYRLETLFLICANMPGGAALIERIGGASTTSAVVVKEAVDYCCKDHGGIFTARDGMTRFIVLPIAGGCLVLGAYVESADGGHQESDRALRIMMESIAHLCPDDRELEKWVRRIALTDPELHREVEVMVADLFVRAELPAMLALQKIGEWCPFGFKRAPLFAK